MKRMTLSAGVSLAAVLVVGASAEPAVDPCVVAHVIDGDTLVCEKNERVRLLLIDAPEAEQGPFGPAAEAFLSTLLPRGARVRLETDVDPRDRYDRRSPTCIWPMVGW